MEIEFDPTKDADNLAKHGLSLGEFSGFDSEPIAIVDDRFDYGETRFRALGQIAGMGHAIVFTMRGETVRLISFRRAHGKEVRNG